MTQPVSYTPAVGFQAEETAAVAGRSTVRTSTLDAELQAVSLTLSQILTNLALIQRDDTQVKDLVVTTASLSANVKALFAGGINPRGIWLTATSYAVKDVVETLTPLISYVCVIAHTSGVFATDRANGKWMVLGSEPGSVVLTDLTLSTGGITLSTNNTQDLAATANRFRSGYFGTTVFAATSVVSPLFGTNTAAQLSFQVNSLIKWGIDTGGVLFPNNDNTQNFGTSAKRIASVFTGIIDSGTTGSLSLKTNNGTTQFQVDHTASAVNNLAVTGSATGIGTTGIYASGTDSNINVQYGAKGSGGHNFFTSWGSAVQQFQILHTASSTRNITVTGSNGGNPTIGVTAGNLAITPAVVLASSLNFASAVGKIIPGATSISFRNNADGADNVLVSDAGAVTIRSTLAVAGVTSTGDVVVSGKRLRISQGSTLTAANNLALDIDGNLFPINGSTQINLISNVGWTTFSGVVHLVFSGTPTVKHNQAASGVNRPILLQGAVDLVATGSTVLTLAYLTSSDTWVEVCRKT